MTFAKQVNADMFLLPQVKRQLLQKSNRKQTSQKHLLPRMKKLAVPKDALVVQVKLLHLKKRKKNQKNNYEVQKEALSIPDNALFYR